LGSKGAGLDIYWNLHQDLWSIRDRRQGLVVLHQPSLIAEEVSFVVQPAGRTKVIATQRKNVHAFVRAKSIILDNDVVVPQNFARIRYNPFSYTTFVDENNLAILSAKKVLLTKDGKCYAEI
jgi:hypothetical protein